MLRYLIGFDLDEFGDLLDIVGPDMKAEFPRSPWNGKSEQVGGGPENRTTIRMKLFLTLLRLRKGYTFREMEGLFGWSKSSLNDVCTKAERILHRCLDGYLRWPDYAQQLRTCASFREALGFKQYADGRKCGVFGAIDCTFYLLPKPMDEEIQRVFYTGYKHIHGLKFSIIVCIMSGRILHITMSPASTTDNVMFSALQRGLLAAGAALFGDKAYQGESGIFSPFKQSLIDQWALRAKCGVPGAQATVNAMLEYNALLGKYRIRVEQAIGELKQWAAGRGEARFRLMFDTSNILERVQLCCKLVNYTQEVRGRNMPAEDVLSKPGTASRKRGFGELRDDIWYLPATEQARKKAKRHLKFT
jgi:hypothetical protein